MLATIIIGAIVLGAMLLIIVKQVKKVKNGESGCGCGCSGCSSSNACHSEIKIEQK